MGGAQESCLIQDPLKSLDTMKTFGFTPTSNRQEISVVLRLAQPYQAKSATEHL